MSKINLDGVETKTKARAMLVEVPETVVTTTRIKTKEIARQLRSLEHFAHVWGVKGGYFLPPLKSMSWHYVSQILAQEKKLLKYADVSPQLNIPKMKGVLVREAWKRWQDKENLRAYFPDFSEKQRVPRTYFFTVRLIRS